MEEYEKVQAPQNVFATPKGTNASAVDINPAKTEFPYPGEIGRLSNYSYNNLLLMGEHFSAFSVRIDSAQYGADYSKLRYVKINFAGLISKIISDMLFSEPLTFKMTGENQPFVEAVWRVNKMNIQCYESALANSALGDACFKLRVGKLNPWDEKTTVIIEDFVPTIYFPKINPFNVREQPSEVELAWTFKYNSDDYLRKEIHKSGQIINQVFKMKGNQIDSPAGLEILGIPDIKDVEETGINEPLIYHVPNWKTGSTYYGISDYYDLDAIFYAINNRMTKTDNILDKHSDPILMVPPGVLDKHGRIKKHSLGVIEVEDASTGKPEYVVWDASLENGFKQIEKLVEFMYLIAEISPDILGVGQGVSDSGRALKFKLMRTIAKAARKKLYYDVALKNILYTAQVLAKQFNLEVDGVKVKGEPEMPEIMWKDGLPIDELEEIEKEQKALDAGITTKKDSIMRVYNVDEETAEDIAKDVKEESAIELPKMNTRSDFMKDSSDDSKDKKNSQDGQKMGKKE